MKMDQGKKTKSREDQGRRGTIRKKMERTGQKKSMMIVHDDDDKDDEK